MIYRKAWAAGTGAASRKVLINYINCIDYADYNDNFIYDDDDYNDNDDDFTDDLIIYR